MYKTATVLLVALVIAAAIGQSASNRRAFVAGKYAIELDGILVGHIFSCDGGNAVAEVVTEPLGPDKIQKKHIAGVKYEDITIEMGIGDRKAMMDWIRSSLDQKFIRKSGAIIAADFDFRETSRREFVNALITEVGMPALDAGSKDAAKMTIKFRPEIVAYKPGSGKEVPKTSKQKLWLPSNFRLSISGLENACKRVNKIEALTIKQKFVEDPRGLPTVAGLEVPNLVITLPEADAVPFAKWHEDFVIKGNATDDKERTGKLEFLAPDLKEVLFTLDFRNLGIFKLSEDKSGASGDSIRRVKAEMYCEDMKLNYSDVGQ